MEEGKELSCPYPCTDPGNELQPQPDRNYFFYEDGEKYFVDEDGHMYIVDSDGKMYEAYDDGTHDMTNTEFMEYQRQLEATDGYDMPALPKVFSFGMIVPRPITEYNVHELKHFAMLALDEFNKDKGTRLQVMEMKKAMSQAVRGLTHYLTFVVSDPDEQYHDKEFQARVIEFLEIEIDQIHPKPEP